MWDDDEAGVIKRREFTTYTRPEPEPTTVKTSTKECVT